MCYQYSALSTGIGRPELVLGVQNRLCACPLLVMSIRVQNWYWYCSEPVLCFAQNQYCLQGPEPVLCLARTGNVLWSEPVLIVQVQNQYWAVLRTGSARSCLAPNRKCTEPVLGVSQNRYWACTEPVLGRYQFQACHCCSKPVLSCPEPVLCNYRFGE